MKIHIPAMNEHLGYEHNLIISLYDTKMITMEERTKAEECIKTLRKIHDKCKVGTIIKSTYFELEFVDKYDKF